MYSVIEAGGFQQKVKLGDTIRVPSMKNEIGFNVEFTSVLLYVNGSDIMVGTPTLDGHVVKGEITAHGRENKVIVFKKKRRQGYELTRGHRQGYTEVVITEIIAAGSSSKTEEVVIKRARVRAAAIAKLKIQNVPLTRKEKIAQGLPKK